MKTRFGRRRVAGIIAMSTMATIAAALTSVIHAQDQFPTCFNVYEEGCVDDDCFTGDAGECTPPGYTQPKSYDAYSQQGFPINDCGPGQGTCHAAFLPECRFRYYRDLDDGGNYCDVQICAVDDIGDNHCDNPQ